MRNVQSHPIKAWRRAGVPLGALECADPAACIGNALRAINGTLDKTPLIEWDCVRGITGRNQLGKDSLSDICGEQDPSMFTNPTEAFAVLAKVPRDSIVFAANVPKFIDNPTVMQALWNARDVLKGKHALLVLLGSSFRLPEELKHDIMLSSEELPSAEEVREIIDSVTKDAGLTVAEEVTAKATEVLRGLSAFAAEQVLATSLTKAGIDSEALWTRKVKMIEQTPGLQVWRGGESFTDIGGLANLKGFLTRILTSGNTPVNAIGFIDEIEKGLAGSQGDTSGTSQDQLQVFLKVMQDLNIPGIILVGHAGTGKSQIAKGAGNVAGCPVISIDTGAMKGSLVGESEGRIRAAMEVFKSVSQGRGLFIATCNKISSLPPELRRRFTLGTFFVDLPTPEERATIWPIWIKRFGLDEEQALPPCEGWTGAEIRACCDVAFRAGLTLVGAAAYVVPVCRSAPDAVEALRKLAHNRFLSASAPGVYQYRSETETSASATGRRVTLE